MESNRKEPFKIEISNDKLVDILMHAATREDIAKLDAKMTSEFARLETKLEQLESKFDTKFGQLESKLEQLDSKFDRKFDRLLWFVIAGILVPIILHFIK